MNPVSPIDPGHKASRKRHLIGFGALLALGLMLVAMTINAFQASERRKLTEAWHVHTLTVLLSVERTRSAVNEALRGEGGYLFTRDADFLRLYERGRREAPRLAAELGRLTSDNARERINLAELQRRLRDYFGVLATTLRFERKGREAQAIGEIRTGVRHHDIEALLGVLDRIEAEERRLLAQRAAANSRAAAELEDAHLALSALAFAFLLVSVGTGLAASRARAQLVQAQAQLRAAASTDDLTGLPNRRAFLAALDVEFARSARSGAPLALALVDLDHFKTVNDRFGHQGGDDVLRGFAEVARETMRAADIVGRLGGEEFAVLMPDTDPAEAGIAGERLRKAVAQRRFTAAGDAPVALTVSIGVASRAPDEIRDRLMRRADEALYQAKDDGRNRTRLAA